MTTTKSDEGLALLQQRAARGDHEAAAVLIIVSHHRLIGKALPFVDRDGVDFAAMMSAHDQEDADYNACPTWGNRGEPDFPARCWCGPFLSTGEHLMLMLAWNLWSGSRLNAIDISELLGTCDDGMLTLAFDAMAARRGRPLPIPASAS
jgi:hypothetical protein